MSDNNVQERLAGITAGAYDKKMTVLELLNQMSDNDIQFFLSDVLEELMREGIISA